MRKAILALATVAAVSVAVTVPADARPWHRHYGFVGPGLAFGLMAGAIAAATAPHYYGYSYYDPYYEPYYGSYGYYGAPAYIGPRYYGYRRWHHHHW